ncbi:UDP-glucosyltransferase UGT13248-like [Lolium perenne]|uniref:UDP-glucosyltransferase UGT13248-like n=1 Tax=Lolium perenne TaxID=4522 RepID=UPI003A990915
MAGEDGSPTLPSFFLDDGRLLSNKAYDAKFFCSDASLDATELEELGSGLCDSSKPFLWVVRSAESHKTSQALLGRWKEKGMVVPWDAFGSLHGNW